MCAQDDWTVVSSTEKYRASNTHSTGGGKVLDQPVAVGFGGFVFTGEEEFLSPMPEKEQHLRFPRGQSYFSL